MLAEIPSPSSGTRMSHALSSTQLTSGDLARLFVPQTVRGLTHDNLELQGQIMSSSSSGYASSGTSASSQDVSSMLSYIVPSQSMGTSTSTATIHPRASLTPLAIPGNAPDSNLITSQCQSSSSSSSTSPPTSSSRPQTAVISRRSDGTSGSSEKSTTNDGLVFCRTAIPSGSQRTVQACKQCRDRKTKCSGTRPTCKRCVERGFTCIWASDIRMRSRQRQQKHRKLESTDSNDTSITALSVPLSQPASPVALSPLPIAVQISLPDGSRSAPPTQLAFTSLDLPGATVRHEKKRTSWCGGKSSTAALPTSLNKGAEALNIMGVPIRPLTSIDDCWDTVINAQVETPGIEGAPIFVNPDMRNPVSVAHLALFRDKQGDMQVEHKEGQMPIVTPYFDFSFGDAEHTVKQGTRRSGDEPSPLPSDDSHEFPLVQCELYFGEQAFPGHESMGHFSEDTMKLFNLPGAEQHDNAPAHELGLFDSMFLPGYATHEGDVILSEQTIPMTLPPSISTQDELIAQFLNADSFV
ncbi:hypothetical protein DFH11DRAFT_1147439 [Phellopilus nigrolimitatus]|nr:hypothetical protein DFH11DRAFT_1147439 [Phellopilus nigrolimitatus]